MLQYRTSWEERGRGKDSNDGTGRAIVLSMINIDIGTTYVVIIH